MDDGNGYLPLYVNLSIDFIHACVRIQALYVQRNKGCWESYEAEISRKHTLNVKTVQGWYVT